VTDLATHPLVRRASLAVGVDHFDAELRRAVRCTSAMRQSFYIVVLLVALAGQVSGAVQALNIPLVWAVPAVAGLELGGIVVLANADVRRRLGERAIASRLLSALIAAGAVAFNWLAHANHLLGAFFSGMSALGYLVWLMHTENQRRDRLRATGDLPPTTPAYEVVEHWLRHPWLTLRAKSLAKANPGLGLYGSLAAARDEIRRERRQRAISTVLHRKIRAAVDPTTADIAVAVYDLDEIATRLAEQADYDTLTALINADLAPARLAATATAEPSGRHESVPLVDGANAHALPGVLPSLAATPVSTDSVQEGQPRDVPVGAFPVTPAGTHPSPSNGGEPPTVYEPTSDEDAAMYAAWQRGVAAGQEPSGADLARTAGRPDDAPGVGRRAARRYRDAHAKAGHSPRPANGQQPFGAGEPRGLLGDRDAGAVPWRHNGHDLRTTGATT
jgi:hypothetical protein